MSNLEVMMNPFHPNSFLSYYSPCWSSALFLPLVPSLVVVPILVLNSGYDLFHWLISLASVSCLPYERPKDLRLLTQPYVVVADDAQYQIHLLVIVVILIC